MTEIVIFHVSHKKNRRLIERYGILSRTEIRKRRNIQFIDIAEKELIRKIKVEGKFNFLDPNTKTIKKIKLNLSDYVPFYFIRPVHRPEVVPSAVYRWQKDYSDKLDYWILRPDFLLQAEYLICIGHWSSTSFGGPLFLDNFRIFVELIKDPSKYRNILQKASNDGHHFIKIFEKDILNILEGNVKIRYLGFGKYRHLMGSSIFIKNSVSKNYLKLLPDTNRMRKLFSIWKVII